MIEAHDAYAALRIRDYRCYLAGGVLGSIGLGVQTVAVGWELYERTGSAMVLGLTGLAQFLPVLLLALPAGQLADRYSRRTIYQLAQLAAATASMGLAALSWIEGPVLLVLACLMLSGTARAFTAPSRSALLPQIIPLETLANAVTWNSTGWQFASAAGPALGGAMLAFFLPLASYVLAACCALSCFVLLIFVRPAPQNRPPVDRSLKALLAGVRFVWQTKLLLAAITLDLFAVLLGGAVALLPIFARDILDVGPEGLGWLRASPALGALVMAVFLAHRRPMQRPGRALLVAVAGFGVAMVAFGLSRNFYLSFAMLALSGALDNISVVVRGTLMQKLTPDEMRGRVSAVLSVFISSSNELGEFESGVTADWFGPIVSVVGGGVGTVMVVLGVVGLWPQLWRLEPLDKLRPAPIIPESDPSEPGDKRSSAPLSSS